MKHFIPPIALLLLTGLFLSACVDIVENSDDKKGLSVKFYNDPSSSYTITSLEFRAGGDLNADTKSTGIGTVGISESWGGNILPAGAVIAPGKHIFFDLDLELMHWVQYRIRVDDGSGNEVLLDYQGFQDNRNDLKISYWGAETRTAYVTIGYNNSEKRIWINGNGDWAGIGSDEETGTTEVIF